MRASILTAVVACSFSVFACGGSQKEAEEPSSEATEESAPKHKTELASSSADEKDEADGKKADDGDEKSDKKDKKSDKKADKDDEEKPPAHTAKDVIAKPDSLWVYSYADSDPHQEAEKKCKGSSKDDPKKTADCMAKASKNQERDALAFQMKGDKLYFLTIDRKGGTLNVTHKIPVDVSDESETKITLKPNGKDEGSKPGGGAFGTMVLELDGESAFAMKDSRLGKLVYQAKLGLMGKQER